MTGTRSYRFAFRPKWVAGHVLGILAVVGFVNLSLWQVRRHDERAAENAVIAERLALPAEGGEAFLELAANPAASEYRTVVVSGTYLTEDEVLWQARTLDGRSGHDVLTPLLVGDRAVIVDRGWVPINVSGPPVAEARPPEGEITVVGVVRQGHKRGRFGPTDPDGGTLGRVSRVDIDRLQQQIATELYPFYVLLRGQVPEQATPLPVSRPLPAIEAGPHLGYAIQWLAFALIAAVGYPVLLYRTAGEGLEDATGALAAESESRCGDNTKT